MAGIDQEIQTRIDAANGNPQAAMQRYGKSQSVLDLISAQLLANQNAEANNAIKAMFSGSNQTELQRLNQQNATSARNDTISAIMPGVAQKAARDQQAMQRQAMGIPSQPAPNMRMSDGGIIGFKKGAPILGDRPIPQGQPSAASQDAEAKDIDNYIKTYRDYEASLANAPTAEEKQDVEARFTAEQQTFEDDIRTKAHQKMASESSMKGMDGFQGGGVVALRAGGGIGETLSDLLTLATRTPFTPEGERSNFGKLLAAIPRGLMGLLQRDKVQPLSKEEVSETMSQYGLDSGYADPNLRNVGRGEDTEMGGGEGIMALARAIDEPTTPPETMYVPSRAEQFSQMFPDVRKAVNESEGSESGAIKYLQMIGEMQAKAKEDEARRALNYIKMMADNRGMIDAADPAANIPKFAGPEGSLVESDIDAAYRERTGRDRPKPLSLLEDLRSLLPKGPEYIINEAGYRVPNPSIARSGEEIAETMREYEERMADIKEDIPGLSLSDRAVLAGQELTGQERSTEKKADGAMPDAFNVASMVKDLGKPQEESEEFRMKGVTDAGKQEEPVAARRGLAGLLDKVEENADMNRLRAFLRGGAGQTSAAGALAGGDRSLAAEDLRQRQLDVQETDVLGRISASRYGSELDYRAALANLRQDERKMFFEADQKLREQYAGAEQDAARTFLSDLEDDQLFNSQFMRLQQEFEGAQLAAETAALKEKYLDDYMNAYRRSGLGVSTGTFGYTAPSE
tara:strand:- start:26709 stop:28934 length:2226 start_codon:yes stop_codon:yes gene_type:complete